MTTQLCNYKIYDWPPAEFVFSTCLFCHIFLFHGAHPPSICQNGTSTVDGSSRVRLSLANNNGTADKFSDTIFDIDLDCSHLSHFDCVRWRQCCQAADSCCRSQLKWQKRYEEVNFINSENSFIQKASESSCSPTWDGFSCFEPTPAGAIVSKSCPSFYHGASGGFVFKKCEPNGTWFAKNGIPWTGYGDCVPSVSTSKFTLGLSLSCLSVVTLLLSILTFLCYHRLRRQIRIRIHISLFATILFYNLVAIPNDLVFVLFGDQDAQLVEISESFFWKATLAGMRFFKVANFSWMFCEGLYLLRVLRNGLRPPSRAGLFYAIGWGFPVVIIFSYYMARMFIREYDIRDTSQQNSTTAPTCDTIVRASTTKSAADSEKVIEWIIHAPCLISLVANYCFLFAIIRIMVPKFTDVPKKGEIALVRRTSSSSKRSTTGINKAAERWYSEQEGTRKATRAIFLLSPLLGTYILFTLIKSPEPTDERWQTFRWLFMSYELIQAAADRIQGFVVSIAFCFSTKAVLDLYKRSLARHNVKILRKHSSLSVTKKSSSSDGQIIPVSNSFHQVKPSVATLSAPPNSLEQSRRSSNNVNCEQSVAENVNNIGESAVIPD